MDVDAERDEPQNEDEESSVNKTATIKKITDLTASELDAFFENFNARLYGHQRLRKNLKRLSNLSEYLISWENIKSYHYS